MDPLNEDAFQRSGQITIIPKPELRGFWGDSLTKPPFGVTSAEVAIICPERCWGNFHCYLPMDDPKQSWFDWKMGVSPRCVSFKSPCPGHRIDKILDS